MLLPSWLWLCAFGAAAPTPQPAEPEPQEETAGETVVAVLPLVVVGELLPRWHTEARARLVSGLSRGSLNVRAADVDADCRDPTCWSEQRTMAGADFVAAATLRVGDARDYALTIEVLSARTGKVVGSNGGTCELCGFEEAVSMIESRAAVLAPEVARLGAVLPVLMFRSDPVGVVVSLDGEVRGPTPIRIQAPAGPHTVEASMAGFLSQTFEIEAVDGVRKEVELRLVPRPDDPLPRGRGLVIAGAVSAGAGLVGLGVGTTLMLLDGRPFRRRCEADAAGTCQFNYETTVGGAVGLSIGGAALAAGVGMLAAGIVRSKRARREDEARIVPTGNGLLVRF